MYTLSNDILTIQVAEKGAELQSIFHRQNQREYMWSGDPAYWGKKSPVLFPIVGELKDHTYTYNSQQYKMSRHGFARDMLFEIDETAPDSLTFSIVANSATLAVYPFSFRFSVKYTLVENIVQVSYIVENTDDKIMYFSVGGHPAFRVPVGEGSFEDYQLVFNQKENVGRWPLSSDGLIKMDPTPLLDNENVLPLTKELFANDAIVLAGLQSNTVSIESPTSPYKTVVGFEGFPYLGIWETKGGDFVCIEPWCGIADTVQATGNLTDKLGINQLAAGEIFIASFTIQVF